MGVQPVRIVILRDRAPLVRADPVLSTIDEGGFDQLWLFAVDTGDGLTAEDCEAISRFRARGGGLLVTRDHMDLGSDGKQRVPGAQADTQRYALNVAAWLSSRR
jgi:hypothetical protein